MVMHPNLKCPICGAKVGLSQFHDDYHYYECDECPLSGPASRYIDEALRTWKVVAKAMKAYKTKELTK